jgi:hypothetical protein
MRCSSVFTQTSILSAARSSDGEFSSSQRLGVESCLPLMDVLPQNQKAKGLPKLLFAENLGFLKIGNLFGRQKCVVFYKNINNHWEFYSCPSAEER